MNEQKQKTITRVGMWLATIVGSIYGLIFVFVGYIINWNHCDVLDGPFWKVLLIAFHSIMMGAYIGELIVRKRAQKRLAGQIKIPAITSRLFVIVLLGSIVAFIVSWEVGYIFGKILGIFQGVSWGEILIKIPLISLIHCIPVCLIAGIFYSVFVFVYLKVGKK
ncbi:MAG: hypothetical protein HQ543_12425 [Bacteroidetes bacterium]|nr:hypothetical protein [Bacteroidota bacterium]